jgi:hydrogenase small subunit
MVSRGALGHNGGCMNTGGICIGCTMPGFPDAFAPFYKRPPGTLVSSTISRGTGGFVSYLRDFTQRSRNLTSRWKETGEVPSGWAKVNAVPSTVDKAVGFFYEKIRRHGTRFEPGSERQKALQASARTFLDSRPSSRAAE